VSREQSAVRKRCSRAIESFLIKLLPEKFLWHRHLAGAAHRLEACATDANYHHRRARTLTQMLNAHCPKWRRYAAVFRTSFCSPHRHHAANWPGAYNNLEMLLSYGYPGRVYLVHPKVPDIMGYKTCPRWPTCRRSRTWRSFVRPGAGVARGRRVRPAWHQAAGGDQPGFGRRRRPGRRTAGGTGPPRPGAWGQGAGA